MLQHIHSMQLSIQTHNHTAGITMQHATAVNTTISMYNLDHQASSAVCA
jgi:hypothetical protein